jgi:hypothetical protein
MKSSRYFLLFIGVLSVFLFAACSEKQGGKTLLFSYFMGNGEDGLHLAASKDGLHWEALNDGNSILLPLVGESVLMRDPCITQGPDGVFHMVWTTSWSGNTIGYANSKDLINWSRQKAIPAMAHEKKMAISLFTGRALSLTSFWKLPAAPATVAKEITASIIRPHQTLSHLPKQSYSMIPDSM